MNRLSAALLAVLLVSPAFAYTFDDVKITEWFGSDDGANQAVCVVTFEEPGFVAAPGASFAFGYRWDGDLTVTDMLNDLNGVHGLTVKILMHDLYGAFLNGIVMSESLAIGSLTVDYPDPSPYLWLSNDGENWAAAPFGVQGVSIANNEFYGFTAAYYDWINDATTTYAPATPTIPEPATMSLLAVATLGLLKRRTSR